MAVIFALSHQPDLTTGLGIWDLIGRKIVHACEYALLCGLWWRALATVRSPGAALAAAAGIAFAYAISDEIHQTFIDGRHGSPVDVAVDSIGIATAGVWLRRRRA
jgi:VanZ family protein